MFKEAIPKISRVGVLVDASGQTMATAFQEYTTVARALKIQVQSLKVQNPNPDFESAFQAAAKGRVNALVTVSGALFLDNAKRIAELAIKNRLPSMHENIENVEAGGLMSYTANDADSYKRAAVFVDKILKGRKPADLPVEQPMRFDFIVNLKTAKQIGVTIEPNVLVRANRVIR